MAGHDAPSKPVCQVMKKVGTLLVATVGAREELLDFALRAVQIVGQGLGRRRDRQLRTRPSTQTQREKDTHTDRERDTHTQTHTHTHAHTHTHTHTHTDRQTDTHRQTHTQTYKRLINTKIHTQARTFISRHIRGAIHTEMGAAASTTNARGGGQTCSVP
jgi:ABC-type Zn2+ transport system substrate-binding protein/surface adhesin